MRGFFYTFALCALLFLPLPALADWSNDDQGPDEGLTYTVQAVYEESDGPLARITLTDTDFFPSESTAATLFLPGSDGDTVDASSTTLWDKSCSYSQEQVFIFKDTIWQLEDLECEDNGHHNCVSGTCTDLLYTVQPHYGICGETLMDFTVDTPKCYTPKTGEGPTGPFDEMTCTISFLVTNHDIDDDGNCDERDNCIYIANGAGIMCDSDWDGLGNACDGDIDDSGSVTVSDVLDFMACYNDAEACGDENMRKSDMDPISSSDCHADPPDPDTVNVNDYLSMGAAYSGGWGCEQSGMEGCDTTENNFP